MKRFFSKLVCGAICTILIVFVLVGQAAYASNVDAVNEGSYLDSMMRFIQDEYYGEVSDDQLINDAIRGMFNSLDDYSTYYNNEERDTFMDSITGVFGGIGVTMEVSSDYIVVLDVFPGSPAENAGILQGDKIIEADGTNLIKVTADKAATIIKGEPGTSVKLGILRYTSSDVIYLDVVREIIKVNPVSFENRNGIGYIKLDMFNENTEEYISRALAEFDKRNIKNLVLDLRDNPGGEVNQAVELAQKFVPEGLITKLDYKSPNYTDQEYYSSLKQQRYKLVVLVNGMTASASEIVSGAIQDTDAGMIIGTKTYGKAKFQSIVPVLTKDAFDKYKRTYSIDTVNVYDLYNEGIFPGKEEIGGYVKMTFGVYYTPDGRMIDGTGLEPDIVVNDPEPVDGVYITGIKRMTKSVEFELKSQGADIHNAKKILKVLGYDINELGNNFDEEFQSALKKYQNNKRIKDSGILDIKTQIAMNADLLELILKYDGQYAEAVNHLQN